MPARLAKDHAVDKEVAMLQHLRGLLLQLGNDIVDDVLENLHRSNRPQDVDVATEVPTQPLILGRDNIACSFSKKQKGKNVEW